MKLEYIVLTHGFFGKYIIESAELIVGRIDNMTSISLEKETSIEAFLDQVQNVIKSKEGKIVFLTDLFGGTPNNVAMVLNQKYSIPVISGLNLPMILEFALSEYNKDESLESFLDNIVINSREAVKIKI